MKLLLLLVLVVPACQRQASAERLPIGSACRSDSDCGSGRFAACADDHPGGYCVAGCRRDDECPANTVCVADDAISTGACHQICRGATDCRTGYDCSPAGSDASHDYCDAPGPRTLLRRIRSRAWR